MNLLGRLGARLGAGLRVFLAAFLALCAATSTSHASNPAEAKLDPSVSTVVWSESAVMPFRSLATVTVSPRSSEGDTVWTATPENEIYLTLYDPESGQTTIITTLASSYDVDEQIVGNIGDLYHHSWNRKYLQIQTGTGQVIGSRQPVYGYKFFDITTTPESPQYSLGATVKFYGSLAMVTPEGVKVASANNQSIALMHDQKIQHATSGQNGEFLFEFKISNTDGRFGLFSHSVNATSEIISLDVVQSYSLASTPVSTPASPISGYDLTATISGQVIGNDGQSVAGAILRVQSSSGARNVTLPASGDYAVELPLFAGNTDVYELAIISPVSVYLGSHTVPRQTLADVTVEPAQSYSVIANGLAKVPVTARLSHFGRALANLHVEVSLGTSPLGVFSTDANGDLHFDFKTLYAGINTIGLKFMGQEIGSFYIQGLRDISVANSSFDIVSYPTRDKGNNLIVTRAVARDSNGNPVPNAKLTVIDPNGRSLSIQAGAAGAMQLSTYLSTAGEHEFTLKFDDRPDLEMKASFVIAEAITGVRVYAQTATADLVADGVTPVVLKGDLQANGENIEILDDLIEYRITDPDGGHGDWRIASHDGQKFELSLIGSKLGRYGVQMRINGFYWPSSLITFQRYGYSAAQIAASTVTLSESNILRSPDAFTTLTAQLMGPYGPVDKGQITVVVDGNELRSEVLDRADGVYSTTFAGSDFTPGTHDIIVMLDGQQAGLATLTVEQTVSSQNSTAWISPGNTIFYKPNLQIVANYLIKDGSGTPMQGVSVTVKDRSGVMMPQTFVTDHDGRGSVSAPAQMGSYDFDAYIDDVEIASLALSYEVDLGFNPELTAFATVMPQGGLIANGVTSATIQTALYVSPGNPVIIDDQELEYRVIHADGSAEPWHRSRLAGSSHFETELSSNIREIMTVEFRVWDIDVGSVRLDFTGSALDVSRSDLSIDQGASPFHIEDISVVTSRLVLYDNFGEPYDKPDASVTYLIEAATAASPHVVDPRSWQDATQVSNGVFVAPISAGEPGDYTVSYRVNGSLVGSTTVTFLGPTLAPNNTEVTVVASSRRLANGLDKQVYDISLISDRGHPYLGGDAVVEWDAVFTPDAPARQATTASMYDWKSAMSLGGGEFRVELTSEIPGSAEVYVRVVSHVTGDVVLGPFLTSFAPYNENLSASPTSLVANGVATSNLTMVLDPTMTGSSVSFVADLGTVGPVTETEPGRYEATYTAGTLAGIDNIRVSVDGRTSNASLAIVLADPAQSMMSTFTSLVADGNFSTAVVLVLDPGLTGKVVEFESSLGSFGPVAEVSPGAYQAMFTAGTQVGTANITARIDGVPSTAALALTLEAPVELLTASSMNVVADGISTSTLSLQLNPMMRGKTVIIDAGLGAVGPVTEVRPGIYEAVFTAGSTPGQTVVRALVDGVQKGSSLTLTLTPWVDTMTTSSPSLLANGVATSIIELQLAPGMTGKTVVFQSQLGTFGAVTEVGAGIYQVTYTAGLAAGHDTIIARVDGQISGASTSVVLNAAREFMSSAHSHLVANGRSSSAILLELDPAITGAIVLFEAEEGDFGPVTEVSPGRYEAIYTSGTEAGSVQIRAYIDGRLSTASLSLTLEAVMEALSASPEVIVANGGSTSTVTLELNPLSTGKSVDFEAEFGTFSPVTEVSPGIYQATFTAGTEAGQNALRAYVDGTLSSASAQITLIAAQEEMTASPSNLIADGSSTSTIVLELDPLMTGKTVSFVGELGVFGPVSEVAPGRYQTVYTAGATAGTETVRASIDGRMSKATVGLTLEAKELIEVLTATPANLLANASSTSTVELELDASMAGRAVSFEAGLGTFGPVTEVQPGRYQATFTAGTTAGDTTVRAYVDGDRSEASAVITLEVDAVAVEESFMEHLGAFALRRMDRIMSLEPTGWHIDERKQLNPGTRWSVHLSSKNGGHNIAGAILKEGTAKPTGSFDASASDVTGRDEVLRFDLRHLSQDRVTYLWAEGAYAIYTDSTGILEERDGKMGLLSFGGDRLINDRLTLGLMGQIDAGTEISNSAKMEGNGWMLGPYMSAELSEGLYLSGRLAFGRSDISADIDVFGAGDRYHADIETKRSLANITLSGKYDLSENVKLKPKAGLAWMKENSDDYLAFKGNDHVKVQGIDAQILRFNASMDYEHYLGAQDLFLTVRPVLEFDLERKAGGTTDQDEERKFGLDLAIRTGNRSNWKAAAVIGFDGIGSSSFRGGHIKVGAELSF